MWNTLVPEPSRIPYVPCSPPRCVTLLLSWVNFLSPYANWALTGARSVAGVWCHCEVSVFKIDLWSLRLWGYHLEIADFVWICVLQVKSEGRWSMSWGTSHQVPLLTTLGQVLSAFPSLPLLVTITTLSSFSRAWVPTGRSGWGTCALWPLRVGHEGGQLAKG